MERYFTLVICKSNGKAFYIKYKNVALEELGLIDMFCCGI